MYDRIVLHSSCLLDAECQRVIYFKPGLERCVTMLRKILKVLDNKIGTLMKIHLQIHENILKFDYVVPFVV